ncbi:uncharacterized, partial [Lates japonicus]
MKCFLCTAADLHLLAVGLFHRCGACSCLSCLFVTDFISKLSQVRVKVFMFVCSGNNPVCKLCSVMNSLSVKHLLMTVYRCVVSDGSCEEVNVSSRSFLMLVTCCGCNIRNLKEQII